MKRTLRKNRQTPPPDMAELTDAVMAANPSAAGDIQDAVSKYSGKSREELMGELVKARRGGLIDPDELASVAERIAPMLTEDQKKRLENVLTRLQ